MNRRQFLKLSIAAGAAGLIGSYPTIIEPHMVQVNRYRVPIEGLPDQFNGFQVVHLTDLHFGFWMPSRFLKNVIRKANALRGDIIVCTGDYVHHRKSIQEIDEVWPILSRLDARQGVYSVLGNHDHWAGAEVSRQWLKRSGQDLHHKVMPLERSGQRLWIAGGGDLWEDRTNLDDILGGIPQEECRIVLAHNPDSADARYSERVDLMISGHTHGGQVSFPFHGPPVRPCRNKDYISGLQRNRKGQAVFISKGIGCSVYPVRFNCYPEIAVLELVKLSTPPKVNRPSRV